jgi:hypothetical protein
MQEYSLSLWSACPACPAALTKRPIFILRGFLALLLGPFI